MVSRKLKVQPDEQSHSQVIRPTTQFVKLKTEYHSDDLGLRTRGIYKCYSQNVLRWFV